MGWPYPASLALGACSRDVQTSLVLDPNSREDKALKDYSHGKIQKDSTKDYESFRLRLDYRLQNMTGMGVDSFGFTRDEIMGVIQFDSIAAVELLLAGTDYGRDRIVRGDHY